MDKKAFTIIELLSVIIILAVIGLFCISDVLQSIDKSNQKAYNYTVESIEKATHLYISNHRDDIPNINTVGSNITITLQDLVDVGLIKAPVKNHKTGANIPLSSEVIIHVTAKNKYHITISFDNDTEDPVIMIIGSSALSINQGVVYVDEGATATDNMDGNLSDDIVVRSTVNPGVPGTYNVTYTVSDRHRNITTVTRAVTVNDTMGPNVAFGTNGSSDYVKGCSTTVNVSDNAGVNTSSLKYQWTTSSTAPTEASFSNSFTNGGTISTPSSVTGSYYLWILAKDNVNNTSISKSQAFNLDNTIPVITLLGSNPQNVTLGGVYTDPGATATDNIDGTITSDITNVNTVNINVGGTYTITYNVSDNAGNNATPVIRTVNVVEQVIYSYTSTNRLPVFGVAGGTYPPTGWTGLQNASSDDAYQTIPLPFNVSIFGSSYNTVYASSNTYLTFGSGSSAWSSLSATNPAYNKIHFGAADNSYQRVSYYSCINYVRIRYEGTASTSGTVGSPNIVAEFTIFNPSYTDSSRTMIEMLIGNHNRLTGAAMIANAGGSISVPYTLAASTSYIFLGDSNGNNFQVFSSAQATNVNY